MKQKRKQRKEKKAKGEKGVGNKPRMKESKEAGAENFFYRIQRGAHIMSDVEKSMKREKGE